MKFFLSPDVSTEKDFSEKPCRSFGTLLVLVCSSCLIFLFVSFVFVFVFRMGSVCSRQLHRLNHRLVLGATLQTIVYHSPRGWEREGIKQKEQGNDQSWSLAES